SLRANSSMFTFAPLRVVDFDQILTPSVQSAYGDSVVVSLWESTAVEGNGASVIDTSSNNNR
ncbi:hypothetical protein SARC_09993, partial [Sphaeroforma arctica JP610]